MAAILVLMIFWSVWTLNLGECGVATVSPEVIENSNNIDMNDKQFIFSYHFRKIIEGIYKNSFDHFNEIIHLSEISDDVNFKADVLSGLYDAMSKAHHTEIPFHAIELYNKIEDFLNVNSTNLYPEKLNELLGIREGLLLSTIVPKGSHLLESAVYVKKCSLLGTPVDKMLKMLLMTNETVSNLTFNEMVKKVRSTLPMEELTPILADLSPNIQQNVDILLALYDKGPFEEAEMEQITLELFKLTKKFDYAKRITTEKRQKIDAIIPLDVKLQDLFSDLVCFYQERSVGNKLYISYAKVSYYESRETVFRAEMKQKPSVFNFRSHYFNNRQLAIQFKESESSAEYQHDVYSSNESVDFNWKVQIEGKEVVLQNLNGTKFLCADEEQEIVHTRNQESFLLHRDECKWFVEDCSQIY